MTTELAASSGLAAGKSDKLVKDLKSVVGDADDLLKELAKGREYEKFMTISDDPDELVEFIVTHPPQKALQQ